MYQLFLCPCRMSGMMSGAYGPMGGASSPGATATTGAAAGAGAGGGANDLSGLIQA